MGWRKMAKMNLLWLLERVARGERILITKGGCLWRRFSR